MSKHRVLTLTAALAALASGSSPAAQAVSFGTGCPGASGLVPTVSVVGVPVQAQPFVVEVQSTPFTAGVLGVGLSNTSFLGIPLPLNLGPIFKGCFLNVSPDVQLAFTTDAAGKASFVGTGATAGLTFFAQAFLADAGPGVLGAFSEGLSITILSPSLFTGGEVIVTEFLANPNFVPDATGEYLELFNTTATDIDIEGFTLGDDGADSVLLDNGGLGLVVPAGGHLVFGRSTDPVANGGIPVAFAFPSFSFFLNNTADQIVLTDQTGFELDRINYDVNNGWPFGVGQAVSLNAGSLDGVANDDPLNWALATCTIGGTPCNSDTGTPGFANDQCPTQPCSTVEMGQVIVTEFMKDPSAVSDTNGEWLEVLNTTAGGIDIEGWRLMDAGTNLHVIDNGGLGVFVPAGGRIVLGRNADPGANGGYTAAYQYSGFFLANGSDVIVLIDAQGQLQDRVDYDDGQTFPDTPGMSIALDPAVPQDAIANNDGANYCHASSVFGLGDRGTPNAPNDPCP